MALDLVDYENKARSLVKDASPHFPVITSERGAAKTGDFAELSTMTGLKTFVTALAGHVAAEAARLA